MPDLTNIDATTLESEGFTKLGLEQFRKVVLSYGGELLKRTTLKADADKADDSNREVTSIHVLHAAHDIAAKPASNPTSLWSITGQVLEYLLTAGAGLGMGHLDKSSGIIAFGVCLALATILLVARLGKGRS